MKKIDRVGEVRTMNCGEEAKIIKYNSARDIDVMFIKTNEIIRNVLYSNFKKGYIKSHFTPTVYGVGIIGEEIEAIKNNKIDKCYDTWRQMLRRCYADNKRYITYKDCEVCEEWKYYPNFKEWFIKNYYEIENEMMCLDKDILIKGNKIYSPNTCIFVPSSINILFTKRQRFRGTELIGVSLKEDKYQANVSYKGKNIFLGYFDNELDAFICYKSAKEDIIKKIADEYKEKIPNELYEALYNYKVEIND